jgi:pimeloyl-ACP methyl ester carboxylesterase
MGAGAPTVILETGLGGSSVDWGFVQPDVARFVQVCSYDRAGIGFSEPGPAPRTARRMARELGELIDRSAIGTPAVLVGASIGGYTARVFASEQPQRVAGLVLVDASHEDQQHDIPRIARFVPVLSSLGIFRLLGVAFGLPVDSLAPEVRPFARATRFRASGYQAAADEILNVMESAAEVRATRRKLPMPVVVVSAGIGADATWQALQRDQVRLSDRGCQVIARQSGHAIPLGQPQIVVDAIRATVNAARGADGALCGSPNP